MKITKILKSIKYRGLIFSVSIFVDTLTSSLLYKFLSINTYIKLKGVIRLGYLPKTEKPRSFNEHVLFLKNKRKNELQNLSIYADKYRVRLKLEELGISKYLNDLVGVCHEVNYFDYEKLPDSFIMKANHGSGMNKVISSKLLFSAESIKSIVEEWLSINYNSKVGGTDFQYDNIIPAVLFEKLLIPPVDQSLLDYKFFCFNGKVEFLNIFDNSGQIPISYVYNTGWEQLSFSLYNKWQKGDFKKPVNFQEMIELCEKLSKPFEFVRIDLYNVNGKIIFGEYTFTPGGGYSRFFPRKWDFYFGQKFLTAN